MRIDAGIVKGVGKCLFSVYIQEGYMPFWVKVGEITKIVLVHPEQEVLVFDFRTGKQEYPV